VRRLHAFGLVALLAAAACGVRADARKDYNAARERLEAKGFEDAAKGFLAARDGAGGDDELRAASAFNLGLAHARHAESLPEAEAARAIELYRQGASWLRDAVRLDPDDGAARVALEVVLRRIQVLVDKLDQGDKALEARLDRLIADQRGALGSIRGLLSAIAAAGGEPSGLRTEHEQLASVMRQLGAEAGALTDLAGDEQAAIRATPEEQRSPERAARLVQLDALLGYLERARGAMAETRLALRRLQGQTAHERGDAALAGLKRAREQLLDPVAVLQRVVGDQAELTGLTAALIEVGKGTLKLPADPAGRPPEGGPDGGGPAKAPPWLTAAVLAAGEEDAGERVHEVRERLAALAAAPTSDPAAPPGQPTDPAAARQKEAAQAALVHLDAALAALSASGEALTGKLADAPARQAEATAALLAAIERFAALRQLIELAVGEQDRLVALLDPATAEQIGKGPHLEGVPRGVRGELPAGERARLLSDGVAHNLDRLARLAELIGDERAQAQAQQQAAPAAPGQAAPEAADATALYDAAEAARSKALAASVRLKDEVAAGGKAGGRAHATALEAQTHLAELRRLFYTLVEHLKELHARQGETHDGTATAQAAGDDERAKTVPPLAEAEARHAATGEALAKALAEQAAALAGAEPQPGGPDPAKQAEAARQAGEELAAANAAMTRAGTLLGEASADLATQSTDLAPAVADQATALEHLANAIKLLEPPQDKKDQDQDQQKNQDQQQQQDAKDQQQPKPQDQAGDPSGQQADRRLQQIRDREAERRRDKQRAQQSPPDPVDKDW
jgi:hypothetical protein